MPYNRYRSSGYSRGYTYKTKSSYKPFTVRRLERKSRNKLIVTAVIAIFLLYVAIFWLLPALIGGLSFLNTFKPLSSASTPIAQTPTLAPPVLNIPYQATNSASINISGYAQPLIKVQIFLDDQPVDSVDTQADGSFRTHPIDLSLGTNNIYGKSLDDKGHTSLPSKTIQLIFASERPTLNLDQPQDNQTVSGDRRITVSGSTDSQKDINITVNGIRIIVNQDGKFSGTISLSDGDNNLTVTASDLAGNTTSVSRKVTYQTTDTPTPSPTPTGTN